jgi:hypothetical protein
MSRVSEGDSQNIAPTVDSTSNLAVIEKGRVRTTGGSSDNRAKAVREVLGQTAEGVRRSLLKYISIRNIPLTHDVGVGR